MQIIQIANLLFVNDFGGNWLTLTEYKPIIQIDRMNMR